MTVGRDPRAIFITGGAGFIGSHFTDRFLAEGRRVTVYDNFSSGKRAWVAHHEGNPLFTLHEADILDLPKLIAAMNGHDLVVHLGANTDNRQSAVRDLDLKNCTIGTWNVLEAMLASGAKELLFASSLTVYGETARTGPVAEGTGPFLPISLYGAGKLAGEALISSYAHLYGLQGWIFRFGNVVGARMGHGVIYDFIAKLQKTPERLEILGDGEQEKPFFLIEDCIDGMLWAYTHTNEPFQVFNLGTETTAKIRRIADIVRNEMERPDATMTTTGGERGWPGDVPEAYQNLGKMRSLGWEVRHTSDEAVRIAARRILEQLAGRDTRMPLSVYRTVLATARMSAR